MFGKATRKPVYLENGKGKLAFFRKVIIKLLSVYGLALLTSSILSYNAHKYKNSISIVEYFNNWKDSLSNEKLSSNVKKSLSQIHNLLMFLTTNISYLYWNRFLDDQLNQPLEYPTLKKKTKSRKSSTKE